MRQRRWRLPLVPSLAALVAISVTVSLGNWQLRRAAEKEAAQQQIAAADRAEPLRIPGVEPSWPAIGERRVVVSGSWSTQHTVYIDNRTHRGISGFYVVTPFRIEGVSTSILVLRGWIAGNPAQRNVPPPLATSGELLQISGRAMSDFPQALELKAQAEPEAEQRVWQNASLDRIRRWSGLPLADFVIRQTGPDQGLLGPVADGLVREWREPGVGVDKHRGYAVQWYGLAVLVLVLWIWNAVFAARRS